MIGALGPNTGVWLLRGSDRARRFLDAVWSADLSQAGINWWDNSAVLGLLGYNIASWPPSFTRATEWSEGTQALPEEWNRVTTWDHWRGARFHHVAGERHFLRVAPNGSRPPAPCGTSTALRPLQDAVVDRLAVEALALLRSSEAP